jgi:hypothetical protein
MRQKPPKRDPFGACQREAIAERRVGHGAKCQFCGESRPFALIAKCEPLSCAECKYQQDGKRTTEAHHVAGRSNHPLTIMIPANDHRARLSEGQRDWPKETLRNRNRSPLLTAAACIRGFTDTLYYIVDELLPWIADMLEVLNEYLVQHFGQSWWTSTPVKNFMQKESSDEE